MSDSRKLASIWSRLRVRVAPAPQPVPPGPWMAAVPYPPLRFGKARRTFGRCEEYLLWEILDADRNALRVPGNIAFTLPWIVSPMRASAAIADDTKGSGGGHAEMDVVVRWLTGHGALRQLPVEQSQQLVEDGHRRRVTNGDTRENLPEGSFEARIEQFRQDLDGSVMEVIPAAMLTVYPWLPTLRPAWAVAATRTGSTSPAAPSGRDDLGTVG